MSAVAMSQVAYARRSDNTQLTPAAVASVNAAAHGDNETNDAITNALGAIVAYFPSEVNILYTGIIAALAGSGSKSLAGQWGAFYLVLVLSPVTVWLLYAARVRKAGHPLPLAPKTWPILEMVFSLIAFAVWAGALPGSPLREIGSYNTALAGIAVLVVTFLLGLIAPIFARPINITGPAQPEMPA